MEFGTHHSLCLWGLYRPDSIPVSGTRISWPMAIYRYLAPIEARLVRAFLFPLSRPE